MNFKDKKIAVIGEGVEGISSAEFLKHLGAKVTVLDQRHGIKYLDKLDTYDLVVRSPGVKLSILHDSKIQNDKITSQTKIFFDLCPSPIIGVTGTKGKGTTSSLIHEMLKKSGKDVYLGGNIGLSPFEFLNKLNPQSIVVLELSSFQLQDLHKSPHIAVLLMITSEHLDYHKTVEEYVDAKRQILRYQNTNDVAILNRDYPASNESDIHTDGKVYFVSREREVDEGCFAREGKIVLRTQNDDIEVVRASELKLRGEHNFENVCAATLASYLAGADLESIRHVLRTFKGLEHRLQLVDTVSGVSYYNDSFSTTPETAIAAIKSFKEPEILILGGSSKNSNFSELGRVLSSKDNIKAIIGIGEEWERIKAEIPNFNPKILLVEGADTMEKIVLAASKIAVEGDVVLLSPACASFGMFKNYKDRGEQFIKEVGKLKQ